MNLPRATLEEEDNVSYVEELFEGGWIWYMNDGEMKLGPKGWSNSIPGVEGLTATSLGDVPIQDDPTHLKRLD